MTAQQPVLAKHHWTSAAGLRGVGVAVKAAEGFNAKFAVLITRWVGSMACAYVFTLVALASLPAVLTAANFVPLGFFPSWLVAAGLIALVAWIAQTFLQLVLLSVIMVGQQVQSSASDARSIKNFEDTELILDRLKIDTEGGIKDAVDAIIAAIEKGKA